MDHGDISDSLFCAGKACGADLEEVEYSRKVKPPDFDRLKTKWHDLPEETATRRPDYWEIEVYSFPQTWGSTALGFGGIGGAAMTTAQTTVIFGPRRDAAVYFGRRLAYTIKKPNQKLMEDICRHDMAACGAQGKYRD